MEYYSLPEKCWMPCPQIQAEHEALIALLNSARAAFAAGSATEPFLSFLEELRRMLSAHFAHEEQIMASHDFPELADHSLHHDFCRARLDQVGDLLLKGQLKPNRFLLDELYDLIVDDVIRADGPFKSFLEASEASIRIVSS